MKNQQSTSLPRSQLAILHVLADGALHSYRDIVLGTGKYSNLPAELRERHPRSLGSKGMVREIQMDVGNDTVATFQITLIGLKAIGTVFRTKPQFLIQDLGLAKEVFLRRYHKWREQYKLEEQEAAKCDLRHNPYLLLKAMADGEEHTFASLARATGIFSGLPQDLRARHARHNSLSSLGLIRETVIEQDNGKAVHAFQITKTGLKRLEKTK